jgi:hypothetical protein
MAKKRTDAFYKGKGEKSGVNLGSLGNGFLYGSQQGEKKINNKQQGDRIVAELSNGSMISFNSTEWYSPELTPDMWLLPKSRMETLRWIRLTYMTDPYIFSIINMLARFPFSKFTLSSEDDKITDFYNTCSFNRKFNLLNFIMKQSLLKRKFGEVIQYGIMSDEKDKNTGFSKWDGYTLFEPEFIEIKQAMWESTPRYYLNITPEMKQDVQQAINDGREVVDSEKILTNEKLLLDDKYVSSIMFETDASATRGTSQISPLMRVIVFQDKINSLKLTAIDRYRDPIELWRIGDLTASPAIKPTQEDIDAFAETVREAKQNKPYTLFIPPFVQYEVVGYGNEQTLFNYTEDYEWIRDAIMVAMGVNKNLILGEGPSMSNVKELGLMKLFSELMLDLDVESQWMKDYYYYPLAEENQFVTKNSKSQYIIPNIDWSKNLEFDHDELEDYSELYKDGIISTETRMSKYKGLSPESEAEKLKKEIGSIWDDGQRIKNRNIKPAEEKPKEEETPEGKPEEVPDELNAEPGKGGESPTPTEEEKPEEKVEETPKEEKPEEGK